MMQISLLNPHGEIMKGRLKSYTAIIILLTGSLAGIFIGLPVTVMNDQEQAELKKGKTFWEWPSPLGTHSMHYVEQGSGDKHILFIHGFRSHTYTWQKLFKPLTDSGYHVWAIDLIGFGLSDKPNLPIYDQSSFVDQISAFMEAKHIDSAHLAGSSMGGGIALNLTLGKPQKVKSLTLICALGYELNLPLYLYVIRHMDFLWGPFLSPPMIRNCLRNLMCNRNCVTEEQVEAYTLPYRLPGGTTASLLTMRQFDFNRLRKQSKDYKQIKQPVLIIWGEKDSLIPISHFDLFLRDFPHAKSFLIADCGHIPQEENPEEVLSAMLPFLENAR